MLSGASKESMSVFFFSQKASLSDSYDSYAMRKFVGINFLEEDAPDATTLLKFRRLLEQHGLNKLFFDAINRVMVETGHML
ncbi:MAG: transposase, partial [Ruminococcaceae bacterium]|nr:transposase [Oscillospiraceae bacterium]